MTRWEFDVAVSTHNWLKRGETVPDYRRVTVASPSYLDASLCALDNPFCSMVLDLQHAGRLGYVRPSDEWMDGLEPLPLVLQQAAHVLVGAGFLPEFEEYV